MKQKLSTFSAIVLTVMLVPSSVWADTYRYDPPPRVGTIYIVVQFKPYKTGDVNPKTNVSVRWGNYSTSKSYGRGMLSVRLKTGFIITLRHTKNDSIPMTVTSEGEIEKVEQLDSPPRQWSDSKYDKYNW